MTELRTSAEARAYLRISRSTLDRACERWRQGERDGLPYVQHTPNGHRKFRIADLDRWAAGEAQPRRLRAAS